jgi:hypothetical protein
VSDRRELVEIWRRLRAVEERQDSQEGSMRRLGRELDSLDRRQRPHGDGAPDGDPWVKRQRRRP